MTPIVLLSIVATFCVVAEGSGAPRKAPKMQQYSNQVQPPLRPPSRQNRKQSQGNSFRRPNAPQPHPTHAGQAYADRLAELSDFADRIHPPGQNQSSSQDNSLRRPKEPQPHPTHPGQAYADRLAKLSKYPESIDRPYLPTADPPSPQLSAAVVDGSADESGYETAAETVEKAKRDGKKNRKPRNPDGKVLVSRADAEELKIRRQLDLVRQTSELRDQQSKEQIVHHVIHFDPTTTIPATNYIDNPNTSRAQIPYQSGVLERIVTRAIEGPQPRADKPTYDDGGYGAGPDEDRQSEKVRTISSADEIGAAVSTFRKIKHEPSDSDLKYPGAFPTTESDEDLREATKRQYDHYDTVYRQDYQPYGRYEPYDRPGPYESVARDRYGSNNRPELEPRGRRVHGHPSQWREPEVSEPVPSGRRQPKDRDYYQDYDQTPQSNLKNWKKVRKVLGNWPPPEAQPRDEPAWQPISADQPTRQPVPVPVGRRRRSTTLTPDERAKRRNQKINCQRSRVNEQ